MGPSCHQKKVLLFGEFIKGSVAYPLPHRQYVFSLPKMLRIYFRNNRELLKKLCKIRLRTCGGYAVTSRQRMPPGIPAPGDPEAQWPAGHGHDDPPATL